LALLLLSSALFAADQRRLVLLGDAQAAFDRVDGNTSAPLTAASACVQAQAAALAVALPAEQPALHYRKGYCELTAAAVTRAPAAFSDAAAELDRAGANMLAWLARQAGQLAGTPPAWAKPDTCPASCAPLLPAAQLWLGWLALRGGDLDAAAQHTAALSESGWPALVAGRKAFQAGRYAEAAARYGEALDLWSRAQRAGNPPLPQRLGPPADRAQLLLELGGAQILSGDPKTAVATLDQALNTGGSSAQAYFLRARARELSGQPEPALADYNLASRTAFAEAPDLASGEAHLYRGILLYRRKDYVRAEEEFASALNFEIPLAQRPDAAAWRHLAAVAAGFCGASRQYLEQALATVSPYFPKDEARAAAAGCAAAGAP
jgi:tetratricopeptide (TPR) repeat protein